MNASLTPESRNAAKPRTLLRRARPSDAPSATELIHLPMGKMADYLFGSDDPTRAREVLAKLFQKRNNRFSYGNADVFDVDGKVAGILLAYPGDLLPSFDLPMANQLRQILSWKEMFRMLKRSFPLRNVKEVAPGEFYIYTIAVSPAFQDHGLGARLMKRAERRAVALDLGKCSLGVTVDNEHAIGFYQHLGYTIVETVSIPRLEKAIGFPGYHRMVKILEKDT